MKKAFILLLFFITSCGYQPIYQNTNLRNFEFKEIIFDNSNYIDRKILNSLSIKKNDKDDVENIFHISSSYEIKEISKNLKGQVELYKDIINVNIKIQNKENKIIKNKNFSKEFTYNNKENKFELTEYQKSLKDNLIDKILNDIVIYLNSE